MQGTEKQVKWATDIRAAKMRDIAPFLSNMSAKLAGKDIEIAKVDALRAKLDNMPAAWWIDGRDVFGLDLMRAAAKD